MNIVNYFIFALIIFFFIFINQITKYIDYYDYPNNARKIHRGPVSKLGGFIIFFICLNFFLFESFNDKWSDKFTLLSIFTLIYIFSLNLLDDYKNISPSFRLISTAIILFFLFTINDDLSIDKLYFSSFNKYVNLNQGSIFFSILCVLLLSNAINLIDGYNGILVSHLIIWYLLILNQNIFENPFYIIILLILLFLLFINLKNISFVGNSGSACIGFFVSILIINSYHEETIKSVENIFLIFLIPGIDMLRLFVARIASKKNPFDADKEHLHHYIMNNFKHNHVLIVYICLSFFPVVMGNLIEPNFHFYLIFFCIIAYFIILNFLKKNDV